MVSEKAVPVRNSPNLDAPAIWDVRKDLAACFRAAALNGLEEGICNHFSAVVPGHEDLFIVNPYGFAFCELTASRLLICNFDGEVVSGEGVPEDTAFFIHAEIHKRLPRAKVVFHTHMPYATALAMTEGDPLIFAGQTALKFYGRTAVDDGYNGLALDRDEGRRIAEAVGDADVVFMKHHGVVVIGETIEAAWDDLYYLERASEVQCLAQSTGRKVSPIDSGIAALTAKQLREVDGVAARLHLNSIKRVLSAQVPPFDS
ncbi:aldolase [Mesorhizobium sp. 113-3-3]|uniref:aldolase n=1 Tax=Mesorhizobium sp. 113-3-3 TaxID=2744516 RepID=UPI0018EA45CC|nr:aldolase [Mesorhizobium sp. 113-3-3]BCG83313.1 hypothetical protein MesoLj113b_68550 [Mesorhizobium sp. 113-3-3]